MPARKYNEVTTVGDVSTIKCVNKYGEFEVEVDTEDLDRIISDYGYWAPYESSKSVMHFRANMVGGKGLCALHRVIMNAPKGATVEYIDGNTCNNRKINLRVVEK